METESYTYSIDSINGQHELRVCFHCLEVILVNHFVHGGNPLELRILYTAAKLVALVDYQVTMIEYRRTCIPGRKVVAADAKSQPGAFPAF